MASFTNKTKFGGTPSYKQFKIATGIQANPIVAGTLSTFSFF